MKRAPKELVDHLLERAHNAVIDDIAVREQYKQAKRWERCVHNCLTSDPGHSFTILCCVLVSTLALLLSSTACGLTATRVKASGASHILYNTPQRSHIQQDALLN